jgi:hypothetical protein
MGGYLTDSGQLSRGRLQMLLAQLAELEQETLEERAQVRLRLWNRVLSVCLLVCLCTIKTAMTRCARAQTRLRPQHGAWCAARPHLCLAGTGCYALRPRLVSKSGQHQGTEARGQGLRWRRTRNGSRPKRPGGGAATAAGPAAAAPVEAASVTVASHLSGSALGRPMARQMSWTRMTRWRDRQTDGRSDGRAGRWVIRHHSCLIGTVWLRKVASCCLPQSWLS